MIGIEHYLTVAAALFVIGVFGLFVKHQMSRIPVKAMELKDVKLVQGW